MGRPTHPDVVLRGKDGKPVIDPDWEETMLAPTSPERRTELAGVVGAWIAKCAADGFDAVEIDNLDTFTRTDGLITEGDAVAQIAPLRRCRARRWAADRPEELG